MWYHAYSSDANTLLNVAYDDANPIEGIEFAFESNELRAGAFFEKGWLCLKSCQVCDEKATVHDMTSCRAPRVKV